MVGVNDLTKAEKDAVIACENHTLKGIQEKSDSKEGGVSGLTGAIFGFFGMKNEANAVLRDGPNAISGGKAAMGLEEKCIDEVHTNKLNGKTPLWEPPSKEKKDLKSEAPAHEAQGSVASTPAPEKSGVSKIFDALGMNSDSPKSLIPKDSIIGHALEPNAAASHNNIQVPQTPTAEGKVAGAGRGN